MYSTKPITMYSTKSIIAALFLLFLAVAPSSGFSLTAVLTRRGKPATKMPSQSLLDFNAQMQAIVAEERRDHYYPYVLQTSTFQTVDPDADVSRHTE
jgi:hypothetical protein